MSDITLRTLSGVGFVAIMLCGLLISPYIFAVLVIFIMTTMMMEFYRMAMGSRHPVSRWIAISTGIAEFCLLFSVCFWHLDIKFTALPLTLLMAVMISAIFSGGKEHMSDYAYILAGLVYIALPMSLSNLVAFRDGQFNALLLLSFFILIWFSDIGAYVIGRAFGDGKKKLAPEISPKKTWVGFWGGMAFCIVAAIVLELTGIFPYPWYHCILLAVIMNLGGVCGDLFESLWKRQFGVKDSGHIIPGHGGMLDRFDSTLIAVPLGAIYLSISGLL